MGLQRNGAEVPSSELRRQSVGRQSIQEDLPVGQHEGYAVFEILGETEDQVKSTLKIDVDIRVK